MTTPSYDRYIIHSSRRTSWFKHTRDLVLTVLLWLIYFYFLRDFFIFMGQIIAWQLHPETAAAPDLKVFLILLFYGKIILAMGAAFLGWALYNLVRFRGKNRRKPVPVVSVEAVAQMYHLTPGDIQQWQQQRVLVMHHDEKGNLLSVSVQDTESAQHQP